MTDPHNHRPPDWADRLLKWFCNPYLLEDLQGDLYELYQLRLKQKGKKSADRRYIWWVIRSFRPSVIKKLERFKNSNNMLSIRNFKIAARVLARDKFNSLLNLLGLTIGIVCFVLMGLYVYQESTYDQFHEKKDRIYRSWVFEDYGEDKTFFNSVTPFRFKTLFEENFPEFESVVQYHTRSHGVGTQPDRLITEEIAVMSPDFFEVFDFQLIAGNTSAPLQGKYDLVISEEFADKYLEGSNPIGERLYIHLGEKPVEFTVSAVMKDIRKSSGIQFDLAISGMWFEDLFGDRAKTAWTLVAAENYVLVKENADISSVESKVDEVVMSVAGDEFKEGEYNIGFQPLTDIHLNPEIPVGLSPVTDPSYVYILGALGFIVLLIAGINYTTLSIGQSLKRSREVGMRKILGATKNTLIARYLSESILLSLTSMAIGTGLAILLIPTFNRLTGTDLVYVFQWWHLPSFLFIGLLVGVLAGIYPSLVLTHTRIMTILRESRQSTGKHLLRKIMVTFQFLITVFLISSTLIMNKQLNYLSEKDLGFTYDAFISVPMHADPTAFRLLERATSSTRNAELLRPELEKEPKITTVTSASHAFGTPGWAHLAFEDNSGAFRWFHLLQADHKFLEAFDISIIKGRDFEAGNTADERQSIIINETAVEYFNLENPIGKKLPGKNFGEHRIIGVVQDFHFSSLREEVGPLVIAQNVIPIYQGISDGDIEDAVTTKLLFKYSGNQLSEAEEILTAAWESVFPDEVLNYYFLDKNLENQYQNEARMNKLIGVATAIAIIIAAIGLLGLTVLVVNSREKEIGIRKVMGASPMEIFGLLARTFSIQLVLGILLSVPLTIWLMEKWLEDFAFRVNIGIDMFLLSMIISVLVAFGVISYHSWIASRKNPVHALRTE